MRHIKRFISWGGGLQSTTMAVMTALGDLPPVLGVIHIDPGFEWIENYKSINFYVDWLNDHGVFTQTIKSSFDISKDYIHKEATPPYWTSSGAPLRRHCTSNFKVFPFRKAARSLAGYDPIKTPHPKPNEFEVWIGFTLDEHERRSNSNKKYIYHRWPLIELNMTRDDCSDYLRSKNLPIPPKSACAICPYRNAEEWLNIRSSPKDWEKAVEIDKIIRTGKPNDSMTADHLYLWKGLKPLDEVDWDSELEIFENKNKDNAHQMFICDGGSCWT